MSFSTSGVSQFLIIKTYTAPVVNNTSLASSSYYESSSNEFVKAPVFAVGGEVFCAAAAGGTGVHAPSLDHSPRFEDVQYLGEQRRAAVRV